MKNSDSNPDSTPAKSTEVIGLFAKFWEPGTVKTRLAKLLGAEPACAVYVEFLTHLVRKLATVGDQRYIVFSPTDKQDEFKNFCGEVLSKDTWQLTPQVDSDLGTRMRTFFDQQFARPAVEKVIVIGADSPQLTLGMIGKAFAELDHHDVVIGPSTDGGYYLLGMRTQSADLFSGIQWSDPSVYLDTVARLDRINLSRFELPPLTDVDEYHDLEALHALLIQRQGEIDFEALDEELLQSVKTYIKARTHP